MELRTVDIAQVRAYDGGIVADHFPPLNLLRFEVAHDRLQRPGSELTAALALVAAAYPKNEVRKTPCHIAAALRLTREFARAR